MRDEYIPARMSVDTTDYYDDMGRLRELEELLETFIDRLEDIITYDDGDSFTNEERLEEIKNELEWIKRVK